jgi:nucleoside-diphosphate-sugar epimerase
MHILTGANGLLGTYIATDYILREENLCCIVRSKKSKEVLLKTLETLTRRKVSEFENLLSIKTADIRDYYLIEDIINEGDVIIHAAACVSFNPQDKQKLFDINIDGTRNLVNAALHKKAKKLIHISSVAAIGRVGENQIVNEKVPWIDSKWNTNYAISKRNAELEVWRGIEEGLDAAIVNPTIVLGYTIHGNSSSSIFHQINKGFPFVSHGVNGYVGAKDVAQIINKLVHSEINNERFILNAGNISYEKLFGQIAQNLGRKPPGFYVKPWMKWFVLPLAKAVSLLTGKAPFVTKEVFRTSMSVNQYSADKIEKRLNYSFTPISQIVDEVCQLMS